MSVEMSIWTTKECVWCDKNILLYFIFILTLPSLYLSSWILTLSFDRHDQSAAFFTWINLQAASFKIAMATTTNAANNSSIIRSEKSSVKSKSWIFNLLQAIISRSTNSKSDMIAAFSRYYKTFIPFCLTLNLPPSDLVFPIYLIKF